MTLYAGLAFALTVLTAIGHSLLGERVLLGPLQREGGLIMTRRASRDIMRAVFHLPSLIWPILGAAVLANRLVDGGAAMPLTCGLVFLISAIGNIAALRRPHPGGLMLLAAATLCLLDSKIL